MLKETRRRASKRSSPTTFQSLVVRIVGPATFEPALAPRYGMPASTRWRMAPSRPERLSLSKRLERPVVPPEMEKLEPRARGRRRRHEALEASERRRLVVHAGRG